MCEVVKVYVCVCVWRVHHEYAEGRAQLSSGREGKEWNGTLWSTDRGRREQAGKTDRQTDVRTYVYIHITGRQEETDRQTA
mmetsp:Transcript_6894/g.16712  ORF Transcript_6894/g.16712 Transcript_6894/m.16712 type:complete len:81 (-) Transcript_6894:10-252(-)